jgi:hypothetical protein
MSLFRIKALFRSAMLSLISWCAYWFYVSHFIVPPEIRMSRQALYGLIMSLFSVIVADYCSLFVVRRCLVLAGDRPFVALLFGAASGLIIIPTAHILPAVLLAAEGMLFNPAAKLDVYYAIFRSIVEWWPGAVIVVMAPAFLVHLWLPAFALGAFGVRLLYAIFQAVRGAQWFLKQGNQHPIRAIGRVAGVLVFMGTAIANLLALIT